MSNRVVEKGEANTANNFPFDSYEEYLYELSKIQPEYRWLSSFISTQRGCPAETVVTILDSIKGHLHERVLRGLSKPDIVDALLTRSESTVTRLVIVTYLQAWSIDRVVVEAIGETYGIDPVFFWQTFDHYYAKNDRLCPFEMRNRDKHGTLWTFPLPSEQESLDAAFIDDGLNALFLSSGCQSTEVQPEDRRDTVLIIMLRDPLNCMAGFTGDSRPMPAELAQAIERATTANYSQRTIANRYMASLHRLSKASIQSADKCPVEYIYPYLHFLAVEVFARLQRQSFLLEKQYYEGTSARAQTEALEEGWAIVHDTRLYMTNSQNSIKKFASPTSPLTPDILRDYEVLMGQIHLIQEDLRDYVSRHLGMMTLEDNKKTIEQAVTVNRLTKLAFIFIPLNFVTSAFGMNLIELGTGKAELWMVFVACVALGMVILTVVSLALRGSKKAVRDYVESNGSTSPLMTLLVVAKSSLRETFWLLVFFTRNSTQDSEAFCRAVNRDALAEWSPRDNNDYPNRQPRFEFPTFRMLSNAEFWEERAKVMNVLITGRRRRDLRKFS